MSDGRVMLEAVNLNAHYGRAHILFDVSLRLARGEVVALLGRNGAGKSTTLKTLMGLVHASGGQVLLQGEAVTKSAPYQRAALGLGYVPEERRIFSDLTVLENLTVGRRRPRRDAPTWTLEKLFELFPNLAAMRERPGGQMSGGEQQMLTIARTLMGNPSCIMLDEPSEGLAPVIVTQMVRAVRALKSEGLALLLSEQNLRFAQAVADRAYVLEKGQVRFAGSMAQLQADAALRAAYLAI